MFSDVKNVNKGKDFVGKAQNARQIRAEEKQRDLAAIKIQVLTPSLNYMLKAVRNACSFERK